MIPAVKHPIEPICLLEEGGKNSVDKKKTSTFLILVECFLSNCMEGTKVKGPTSLKYPWEKKKKNVDDFRWYTSVWSDNKLYDREEMLLDIS